MRRALTVATLALAAAMSLADVPLALMRTATDPSRMGLADATALYEFPCVFAEGWETGLTYVAWARFACQPFSTAAASSSAGLMLFASHTLEPARATREGGAPLPDFLDLARVPLGADGTWGAADVVPQDAATVPGRDARFVVCVNCSTDSALTLTVGGAELAVPATNDYVRNLEISPGDASVAVSAAAPGANVRLALAINPWRRFVGGPEYTGMETGGGSIVADAVLLTNCWTLVALRASLAGGVLSERLDLIDRAGARTTVDVATDHPPATLVRDARFRLVSGALWGVYDRDGARRRLDLYGVRVLRARLPDEALWRIWELDLAELRRRGLDTAIWAPGEGPQ